MLAITLDIASTKSDCESKEVPRFQIISFINVLHPIIHAVLTHERSEPEGNVKKKPSNHRQTLPFLFFRPVPSSFQKI